MSLKNKTKSSEFDILKKIFKSLNYIRISNDLMSLMETGN